MILERTGKPQIRQVARTTRAVGELYRRRFGKKCNKENVVHVNKFIFYTTLILHLLMFLEKHSKIYVILVTQLKVAILLA